MSRQEIARRLYPESDSSHGLVAVRQTLLRLKGWLGTQVLEEQRGCLRLVEALFEADWTLTNIRDTIERLIAPGLNHPWVEVIRLERQRQVGEPSNSLHQEFTRTVETVAEADRDAARCILAGGHEILKSLELPVASRLLGLTEPKHRWDPCAFEHSEMRGQLYYHLGAVKMACKAQARSFRLAGQQRSQSKMARAAALTMFAELESGSMDEAWGWMVRVSTFNRVSSLNLLLVNAHAAFLWNSNRVGEAIEAMIKARATIHSVDRAQTVHYWSNLALLAAEAGNTPLAFEAEGQATSRMVPQLDYNFASTLSLARVTSLMASGNAEEARSIFLNARLASEKRGHRIGYWYATEGYAESLAHVGQVKLAAKVWGEVEAARSSANLKLTPRLAARKARILAAA
jgi:hypothetical protein